MLTMTLCEVLGPVPPSLLQVASFKKLLPLMLRPGQDRPAHQASDRRPVSRLWLPRSRQERPSWGCSAGTDPKLCRLLAACSSLFRGLRAGSQPSLHVPPHPHQSRPCFPPRRWRAVWKRVKGSCHPAKLSGEPEEPEPARSASQVCVRRGGPVAQVPWSRWGDGPGPSADRGPILQGRR